MGYRLTRIVTRTGDDGTTGLGDGSRVSKDAPRIALLGDLDELNSALGCVLAEPLPGTVREALQPVQQDLFDLGGELCIPGRTALRESQVQTLETRIATLNEALPPLKDFVLPGGPRAAAACHLARAIGRRAERSLVALGRAEPVSPVARRYLNRLSDLLFVCARAIARESKAAEPIWTRGKAAGRMKKNAA